MDSYFLAQLLRLKIHLITINDCDDVVAYYTEKFVNTDKHVFIYTHGYFSTNSNSWVNKTHIVTSSEDLEYHLKNFGKSFY